jgi:LysM repeat protein
MNILKLLGVVVGIHVVAYLVIAQPGCRSTATKPATSSTAIAPAARSVPSGELQPSGELSPISLNLPFAQAPAPAGDRFAPTRPGTEAAAAESTPAKTYTVKKGDSLYTIAHKNGITVNDLAAANNLATSVTLRLGQKLVVPTKGGAAAAPAAPASPASYGARSSGPAPAPVAGGATYTVKSGDTLSKIASRNHTTSDALRTLNGISGDHLKIGQVLQLPGNGSVAPSPALPPPPAAMPTSSSSLAASSGPGVHTVAPGESAESIARKYQISVGELVRANQITDPKKIRIGQVLTIPGAGAARAAKPAPSLVPEIAPASAEPAAPVAPVVPVIAPDAGADAVDAPMVPVDEPSPVVPASR